MPRISLALLPPERPRPAAPFEHAAAARPVGAGRVAPAVERPGIHLGVWRRGGDLQVWGTTRVIPPYCLVLEVAAPGLLVIKHHRGDGGKYVNVAVLEGDQIKVDRRAGSSLPDCPALVTSLLGFDSPASWHAHRRTCWSSSPSRCARTDAAGSMLMVPSGQRAWRESIVQPMPYPSMPPFSESGRTGARAPTRSAGRASGRTTMDDMVRAIAGLTAVDGATIITDRYELLAFGAKIARRDGFAAGRAGRRSPSRSKAAKPSIVHPSRLGGTRHLSAAQFVHDQQRCDGAGRVAGRPVHGLRLVAVREHGPRASGRNAAAVTGELRYRLDRRDVRCP